MSRLKQPGVVMAYASALQSQALNATYNKVTMHCNLIWRTYRFYSILLNKFSSKCKAVVLLTIFSYEISVFSCILRLVTCFSMPLAYFFNKLNICVEPPWNESCKCYLKWLWLSWPLALRGNRTFLVPTNGRLWNGHVPLLSNVLSKASNV